MNSMMNVGEVMNDRELVARILTTNLIKYGDILPDGFDFQATHGTEATSVVPMRRSNYLRYAAYLHEDSSHNPHFVSGDDLLRLNCSLKKGARPLYLESWYGSPETGFSARLVEYYNVDDVKGEATELDDLRATHVNQSQPERLSALRDFLSADPDFELYDPKMDTAAEPAAIIHEYVMHKLATQYPSQDEKDIKINTAVCQNLFHDFGIDYYNQENPLFFEHEVQEFKKHPRQLFDIFMEASKRYSKLEKEITRLQSVQQEDSKPEKQEEESAKELPENAPFKTLKVHLDFIDSTITHPLTGEIIAKGDVNQTYVGEEAYLLLSSIIHKDKEIFSNSLNDDGDGKASFSLEYGKDDDKVILEKSRHDLGYLGYGNKCSVADSLTYAVTKPYQFLLNSDEYMNSYYGKTLCNGLDNAEERVNYCHNKIEAAKHAFHSFQEEEKSYLASQKEVDSYNHYQAKLYTYICRKEDMDANMKSDGYLDSKGLKEITRDIIPAEKMKNYCVIPVGRTFKKVCQSLATSDAADTEYENYTSLRNGLPPSMVAFTTTCPPTSDLICHKPVLNVMYAGSVK